jgi:3-oxoacyl-[acyl-carrier protein] reductase
MKLLGKKAFVTGGGAGIGRAIVGEFLREGAHVYTNDISEERVASLRAEFKDAHLVAGVGDLASPGDITRMLAEAKQQIGVIDVLVNNAGIHDYLQGALEQSIDTWNRVLAVNLTSHLLLARGVLPAMMTQKSGAIVTISSAAGLVAGGGGVAYTTSKHASIGLAKQLASEFGPHGIRVNVICPGVVSTPLLATFEPEVGDAIKAFTSMTASRRLGTPLEIARATVFLASDDASFMYGSVVAVDGGYTLF